MLRYIALISSALLAGCQANRPVSFMPPHFRVESAIEPGDQAGTFVVTTRIHELRDGTWEMLTAPRITIQSGQSAFVIIDGDRKIRVDPTASGTGERANGSVKVDVSKQDQSIYGSEQQLTLATRRG